MSEHSIYRDIAERTGGDIYIGVVGPVRTGKSTFIKRFMEEKNVSFEVAKKLRDKNNCDLVVANDLENIRNGNHIAYLIAKDNSIEELHGKNEIAKSLVKRLII